MKEKYSKENQKVESHSIVEGKGYSLNRGNRALQLLKKEGTVYS